MVNSTKRVVYASECAWQHIAHNRATHNLRRLSDYAFKKTGMASYHPSRVHLEVPKLYILNLRTSRYWAYLILSPQYSQSRGKISTAKNNDFPIRRQLPHNSNETLWTRTTGTTCRPVIQSYRYHLSIDFRSSSVGFASRHEFTYHDSH